MTHPEAGEYSFGRDRHDSPPPGPVEGTESARQAGPGSVEPRYQQRAGKEESQPLTRAEIRRQREARRPLTGHSSRSVAVSVGVATALMLVWTGAFIAITLDSFDSLDGDTDVFVAMAGISTVITIALGGWLLRILKRRREHGIDRDEQYVQIFGHDPDDGSLREYPSDQRGPGPAEDAVPGPESQAAALTAGLEAAARSSFPLVPPPPPGFRGRVTLAVTYLVWALCMVYTLGALGALLEQYSLGYGNDAAGLLFLMVVIVAVDTVLLARIIIIHRRRRAYRRILDLTYQELLGHQPEHR